MMDDATSHSPNFEISPVLRCMGLPRLCGLVWYIMVAIPVGKQICCPLDTVKEQLLPTVMACIVWGKTWRRCWHIVTTRQWR